MNSWSNHESTWFRPSTIHINWRFNVKFSCVTSADIWSMSRQVVISRSAMLQTNQTWWQISFTRHFMKVGFKAHTGPYWAILPTQRIHHTIIHGHFFMSWQTDAFLGWLHAKSKTTQQKPWLLSWVSTYLSIYHVVYPIKPPLGMILIAGFTMWGTKNSIPSHETLRRNSPPMGLSWWLIPRIVSGWTNPGYKWDKWGQGPLITGVISHLRFVGWTTKYSIIPNKRIGSFTTTTAHHPLLPVAETRELHGARRFGKVHFQGEPHGLMGRHRWRHLGHWLE